MDDFDGITLIRCDSVGLGVISEVGIIPPMGNDMGTIAVAKCLSVAPFMPVLFSSRDGYNMGVKFERACANSEDHPLCMCTVMRPQISG